jgi:hypothetical protein
VRERLLQVSPAGTRDVRPLWTPFPLQDTRTLLRAPWAKGQHMFLQEKQDTQRGQSGWTPLRQKGVNVKCVAPDRRRCLLVSKGHLWGVGDN